MISTTSAQRRASLSFYALVLLVCIISSTVLASGSQWVRIHHSGDNATLNDLRQSAALEDYGSLLWGQLDGQTIQQLRAEGIRVNASSNPFVLNLGGESFDPLDSDTIAYTANPDGDFHLVQFDGPIRPEWVSNLRAQGIEVVQPLHPFSYIVWADAAKMSTARSLDNVRWTGPMQSDWKVQPEQRNFGNEIRPTMMLASAHVNPHELRADLSRIGEVQRISSLGRHFRVIQMDVAGDLYSELAQLPAVYAVQYVPQDAGPRGEMSNQSIVGNIDGAGDVFPGFATWLSDTGFNGSGITVGVVDGRVRTTHVDLADRMSPCLGTNGSCTPSGSDAHGTHVAGAIAGTGATGTLLNGFLRGQGVAPGANIVTQEYGPFLGGGPGGMVADGMLQIYQDSADSGALLTNNSWGPTGSPQGYDIPTQQIDFISRDADPDTAGDQPVLAVWSIMNGNGDSGGACAPSSLGSPDEAKNLFAVGSTALQDSNGDQLGNIFRISTNSGHGPACDGRNVPHIVAPGCSTDSTTNTSDTAHSASFCGTSMASPVVSGAVSVWAENYVDTEGVNPSPALVKAVFTAAAQDLVGNPNADGGIMGHRPDRFQGYGRLDLEQVMNHGVEVFMTDQETVFSSTGQDWSLALNAVDPSEPIRIMLAWTDAPGAGLGGTTPAWVNNLDLSVDADGDTYLGNVIGVDGWSATGGTADDRNNLEGVFLSPAQHNGAVGITVTAADLAGDALNPYDPGAPSQDFALACYNCIIGDPTFTVSIEPEILGVCIPDSGSIDEDVTVNLGTLGVYSGTVDLTASTGPTGLTSSLDPTSVVVPGSSTWTINIDSAATPGSGTLTVGGDDGQDIHTSDLALTLDAALVDGPALIAPADAATDTSLTPEFSWDAITDVDDYSIQVATDAGFTSLVIDETVTATSFTPTSDLATGTEYFWRVAGVNLCGEGAWGEVRSFTTRQEPVADFSASQFSMTVASGASEQAQLVIGNTGTGNLTWSVETDQLGSVAARGTIDPGLDEVLDVGSFSVTGDASGGNIEEFIIPGGIMSSGTVLGFEFEGTVSGITGNSDWASDLRMIITSPDGASFNVGGFSDVLNDWDFQGSGSADDGTYSSSHPDVFAPDGTADEGDWTLTFQHGWASASAGTMNWSDVTVTLLKQPLPYCQEPLTSVPWLSVDPVSGIVAESDSEQVTITVDTTGLAVDDYLGYLCISTNDPNAEMVPMAVELSVTENPDEVFEDRFESP